MVPIKLRKAAVSGSFTDVDILILLKVSMSTLLKILYKTCGMI